MWVTKEAFQYRILTDWLWEMRGKEEPRMLLRCEASTVGCMTELLSERGTARRDWPHGESEVRFRVLIEVR